MAVVKGNRYYYGNDEVGCFYCGEPLEPTGVTWMGSGENPSINFHPTCAVVLANHLINDVAQLPGGVSRCLGGQGLRSTLEAVSHLRDLSRLRAAQNAARYENLWSQAAIARQMQQSYLKQKDTATAADRAALSEALRSGQSPPESVRVGQLAHKISETLRLIEGLNLALEKTAAEVEALVEDNRKEWRGKLEREKQEVFRKLDEQLSEAQATYEQFIQREAVAAWLAGPVNRTT